MAYPERIAQTVFDAVTPVAVTSSTDATPIVVTATAHGLAAGQRVLVYGHATNIAANGIFLVKAATTNTFTLGDEITNADVAGSGAGAGSGGICMKAPPVMHISDFKAIDFEVGTSGTATMTLGIAASLGKVASATGPRGSLPNFGATQSPSNPWYFMQCVDLATGSALNGTTGIVIAGTDINNQYEVNTNLAIYFTVFPISWSAGALTVKAVAKTER